MSYSRFRPKYGVRPLALAISAMFDQPRHWHYYLTEKYRCNLARHQDHAS